MELSGAVEEMESSIQHLEARESELRGSVTQIVGNLSDLRYGRLANPRLPAQVMEGLSHLEETCKPRT
jgi:centromere-localized protein 2